MPTLSLPRLAIIGKTKPRSLIAYIRTQDRKLIRKELPILFGNAYQEAEGEDKKYLIDDNNQYLDTDGNWCQFYDEKSFIPLALRTKHYLQDNDDDEKQKQKLRNELYIITRGQAADSVCKKMNENEHWQRLQWIISIVMGGFVLIAAIVYFGG